jgi:hypothetical protein
MRKSEIRAAAAILRAIIHEIQKGELTAPGRLTARLEGALTALAALANRSSEPRIALRRHREGWPLGSGVIAASLV